MTRRAKTSGVRLSVLDAAIIKGMLARGDRQHDVAAWFGVNGGRVAEIASGRTFGFVCSAPPTKLPPPGPYPNGRNAMVAIQALEQANTAIEEAKSLLRQAR